MKKRKKNYINNADLLEALKVYLKQCDEAEEAGKQLPQVPLYISECFMSIANRLASRTNFSGYMFKEDMIMDGIEDCLQYMRNFDPEKGSNPFAYFTQYIWNAFIRRIKREKHQMYIKYKSGQDMLHIGDTYEGNETLNLNVSTDYINAFIEDYESKLVIKKKIDKTNV